MDAIQKYVWNCDDKYILNLSRRTQQFKIFIPADKDNLFKQSRASLVSNNFLYSSDLNVWWRGDIERKN